MAHKLKVGKNKFEVTKFFKVKQGTTIVFSNKEKAMEAARKHHKTGNAVILHRIIRTPKGGLTGRTIIRRSSRASRIGKNIGKFKTSKGRKK